MSYFSFKNVKITGISVAVPEVIRRSYASIYRTTRCSEESNERLNDLLSRTSLNDQTTSDLGFIAARAIINKNNISQNQLVFLVFVTSTPDYRSPATATVLHKRLELTEDCACFDINSGGTGLIQGLQVGCSMLLTSNKDKGIIIIGDTTSKLLNFGSEKENLFGDSCAAILLEKNENNKEINLSISTDSNHFRSLINPTGGFRHLKEIPMNQIQGFTDSTTDYLIYDISAIQYFSEKAFLKYFEKFLSQSGNLIDNFDMIICNYKNEALHSLIKGCSDTDTESKIAVQSFFGFKNGATAPLILASNIDFFTSSQVRVLTILSGEGMSWGIAAFTIDTAGIIPVIETGEFYTEGSVSHDM